MTGTLGLSTPWARAAIPSIDERRAIEADIPDGYTVGVSATKWHVWVVWVVEQGATMHDNRVIWRRDGFHDIRYAIDAALRWLAEHDTATYAGVEVPVR